MALWLKKLTKILLLAVTYLLKENRKRGQEKDMPICVVFFPIAETMSDRTAISYQKWKPFDTTERVDILFSRARRKEVQRHNEQVRQNRETLKTISEAVLFLSKQELAFRGVGKIDYVTHVY